MMLNIPASVEELLVRKGSPDVHCIPSSATILQASEILAKYNIGALVVLDAEESMPVGIISERDIVRSFQRAAPGLERLPVAEAMTKDVIIAVPEDSLAYVSAVMTQCHIRHLPVMRGKRLVGILSIGDVVNAQISETDFENRMLRDYIEGKYPA